MNRSSGVYGLSSLVLVALLATSVPTWAAETFGYTSRKPQLWETQPPLLEQEPGNNLYWHDPQLETWEMCRSWPPAANGCPPLIYGKVDFLPMFRDMKTEYPMATLGPGGGIALSTGNFRSEFDAGMRALIGLSLGDWYRMEAVYFGSYDWDDTVAVRNLDANDQGGTGNLYSPFSNFGLPDGVVGLDYNNFVSLHFSSRLNNGELNMRRRVLMRPGVYETSFLFGTRYMDLREQFDYFAQSAAATNAVSVGTKNKMIGADRHAQPVPVRSAQLGRLRNEGRHFPESSFAQPHVHSEQRRRGRRHGRCRPYRVCG